MLKLKNILAVFLLLPILLSPKIFVVVSASMEPAIKSGSLVFTKSIDPKSLKIGDVIAFSSPNNPKDSILHRINSIKNTLPLRFTTKGDRNNVVDQWDVTAVGVKGIYQFSIPYLGYLIDFIRHPLGFIIVICLPALLCIIFEILKITKYFKKKLKNIIPLLFLFSFSFLSLTLTAKNIFAIYTSNTDIRGLSFSIKENILPESSINLYDINTQNVFNFDIASTATDNSLVSIIRLYYSFNSGPWILFPDAIGGGDGLFPFTSPFSDGLYSFESLATDSSNNIEVKNFDYFNNQIKVDTIAPTTNLDNKYFPSHIYTGQDYLINGNFENGMEGWIVGSSIGDHHIVNIGVTNNAFILGSENKSINSIDSLYQIVSLPASSSSTLNFSYRFLSHDTADFDRFNVNLFDMSGTNVLENILNFGSLNSDDFNYDSGWITLSRSLTHLAGQTFKLLFSLTDTGVGETSNSLVFLDNIKISTLDTRVGETTVLSYLSTDLGSLVIDPSPETALTMGENNLSFTSSLDSSGNIETIHHQSVLVSSALVLNKISKNTISIFNNLFDESIDLTKYFYSVNDDSLISLNSLDIILPTSLPDSCQIKLFYNNDLIDSVNVTNLDSSTWQRSTDGLGPWIKIDTPPSFNLESRLSVSKITLSVFGLVTTLSDMSYTIDFSDSSGLQQIYGHILPNTIDAQGSSSRDFYLGTCSSGGTCLPVSGLGSSFVVTFSDLAPKTFIFD